MAHSRRISRPAMMKEDWTCYRCDFLVVELACRAKWAVSFFVNTAFPDTGCLQSERKIVTMPFA